MIETKSLCGAVTLLATIFEEDIDRLKLAYGIPEDYNSCLECARPLVGRLSHNKEFCSRECRHSYAMIKLACAQCGKIFRRQQSEVISRTNRVHPNNGKVQQRWFCSRPCRSKWMSENPELWYVPHHKYDYEEIIQLIKDGLSNREISIRLGMPLVSGSRTCSNLRRLFNLPSGMRRKWDYDEIRRLRAQGFKLREIAERLGASTGSIGNAFYHKSQN